VLDNNQLSRVRQWRRTKEEGPVPRAIIEVRNLRKEYPVEDETVVALDRVNLSIPQGQICCIFGESGSGKSTLLNQLAGMEKPTRGGVRIGGVPVSKLDERELAAFRQKHLGFVFQSYNLLPNLTALENVAMPLMFRGVPKEQRERAARGVLKRVGLGHRLSHYPRQMSGGQQQRVGIARAFVTKPEVVFADEPTGNLDSKTKTEVMTMICAFAHDFNQTIVLVTHDPQMASYADRIVTLLDGRITSDRLNTDLSRPTVPSTPSAPTTPTTPSTPSAPTTPTTPSTPSAHRTQGTDR
jgi:putative ABC transport system ATP-binding protein